MSNTPQPTKQNLLLLTTELRPGGAEKSLVQIATEIDPQLFQVTVVSIGSRPSAPEDRLVNILEQKGIRTLFLNCDSRYSFFRAVGRLRKIIREEKIDIVQSFLYHANVLAGWAIGKSQLPRLFTGIRVADPRRIRHRIERWVTRNAEKVICVSRSVLKFAARRMKIPRDKLIAIPNGIPTELVEKKFHPAERGIRKPFAVFVGRLQKQKGLIPFLEYLAKVETSLSDFDLVLVGDGPDRHQLEILAGRLGRHRVHFLGWQKHPGPILRESDVTILPSIWEGMPNVILETMGYARPFVAFAVDGVVEMGKHENRQLIPPGDYQKFFQRLSEVVTDKRFASRLGDANRKRVENDYSLKKMIANYETAYLRSAKPPG